MVEYESKWQREGGRGGGRYAGESGIMRKEERREWKDRRNGFLLYVYTTACNLHSSTQRLK